MNTDLTLLSPFNKTILLVLAACIDFKRRTLVNKETEKDYAVEINIFSQVWSVQFENYGPINNTIKEVTKEDPKGTCTSINQYVDKLQEQYADVFTVPGTGAISNQKLFGLKPAAFEAAKQLPEYKPILDSKPLSKLTGMIIGIYQGTSLEYSKDSKIHTKYELTELHEWPAGNPVEGSVYFEFRNGAKINLPKGGLVICKQNEDSSCYAPVKKTNQPVLVYKTTEIEELKDLEIHSHEEFEEFLLNLKNNPKFDEDPSLTIYSENEESKTWPYTDTVLLEFYDYPRNQSYGYLGFRTNPNQRNKIYVLQNIDCFPGGFFRNWKGNNNEQSIFYPYNGITWDGHTFYPFSTRFGVQSLSDAVKTSPYYSIKGANYSTQAPTPFPTLPADTPASGSPSSDSSPTTDASTSTPSIIHIQPQVSDELYPAWPENDNGECAFLKRFYAFVNNCKFKYDKQDLVRFHTAVKVSPFTLLGGLPGSGKSSLVELYQLALSGSNASQSDGHTPGLLQVSVCPSWAEPADLMGYESNLTGKTVFHESSSGICTFLRNAEKEMDTPHLICFEEMNLACVEHYFSDFIQLLSRPPENRILRGYRNAGYSNGTPENNTDLRITDNIRFTGTCNFDVTTQEISERFYDRCAYIELQTDKDMSLISPNQLPEISQTHLKDAGFISYEVYNKWVKNKPQIPDEKKEHFLEMFNARFREMALTFRNVNLPISPRVRNQIVRYVWNRPPMSDEERTTPRLRWEHALDEAFAQYVIPKFRPSPFAKKKDLDNIQQKLNSKEDSNIYSCSKRIWNNLIKRYPIPEY